MLNVFKLKVGSIITLKQKCVKKYGLHEKYIKYGDRPFYIAEFTEYNAIWVVPCYSNCNEPIEVINLFHQELLTPEGIKKYLNFRNMFVVENEDICSEFKCNKSSIQILNGSELKTFLKTYLKVKTILLNKIDLQNWQFMKPYFFEKNIFIRYSESTYNNLESDFNIVNRKIIINKQEEWDKSQIAYLLYNKFVNLIVKFRKDRDLYIPTRRIELIDLFSIRNTQRYTLIFTENGYISQFEPELKYTDKCDEAMLINDVQKYKVLKDMEYIDEYKELDLPMLDRSGELGVAKELIFLDYNVVSHRSFYKYFGQINKSMLNDKLLNIKENLKTI